MESIEKKINYITNGYEDLETIKHLKLTNTDVDLAADLFNTENGDADNLKAKSYKIDKNFSKEIETKNRENNNEEGNFHKNLQENYTGNIYRNNKDLTNRVPNILYNTKNNKGDYKLNEKNYKRNNK